jgi:hypothetical protein
MPVLGTTECVKICRHCTYEEIYRPEAIGRGETPLNYGDWLLSVWLPFVADRLA